MTVAVKRLTAEEEAIISAVLNHERVITPISEKCARELRTRLHEAGYCWMSHGPYKSQTWTTHWLMGQPWVIRVMRTFYPVVKYRVEVQE